MSDFVVPNTARPVAVIGLDVVLDIKEHHAATRPGVPAGPRKLIRTYVDEERLGVKSGRGFHGGCR